MPVSFNFCPDSMLSCSVGQTEKDAAGEAVRSTAVLPAALLSDESRRPAAHVGLSRHFASLASFLPIAWRSSVAREDSRQQTSVRRRKCSETTAASWQRSIILVGGPDRCAASTVSVLFSHGGICRSASSQRRGRSRRWKDQAWHNSCNSALAGIVEAKGTRSASELDEGDRLIGA